MSIDVEELRNELKNKIDEIIDSYIESDNTIMEIPNEKIYMEFSINGQNYIAFTENEEDVEELEMMFAKVDLLDNNKILRNIESDKEFELVVNEFNRRIEYMSD